MIDFLKKDVADESKKTDMNRRELLKKNLPALIVGMLTGSAGVLTKADETYVTAKTRLEVEPMIDTAESPLIEKIAQTDGVVGKKRQFIEEAIKRIVKAVSHKNTLKI